MRDKSGGPVLIAGPCAIESMDVLETVARELVRLNGKFGTDIVFKASFDKANRTSLHSYRGPGIEKGLEMLGRIKSDWSLQLLTDIHEPWQADVVARVVDVIQIPAFLCRQTDLLVAAARTGKVVNIKKAQFLSGEDMAYPVQKVLLSSSFSGGKSWENTDGMAGVDAYDGRDCATVGGSDKVAVQISRTAERGNVWLTERGNIYGYNNLVVDFRNIAKMKKFTPTVIMDCTHSVQTPGGNGSASGGDSSFVPAMALAAKAFGATGFFFEVHPDPSSALSDASNMLRLDELESVISQLLQ